MPQDPPRKKFASIPHDPRSEDVVPGEESELGEIVRGMGETIRDEQRGIRKHQEKIYERLDELDDYVGNTKKTELAKLTNRKVWSKRGWQVFSGTLVVLLAAATLGIASLVFSHVSCTSAPAPLPVSK